MKKKGLTSKENINEALELLFNIKLLCFTDPENISYLYKKIKEKYKSEKYNQFFKYFQNQWYPKSKYNSIKCYPNWNYFNILKSIHINKLLNVNLISKYHTLDKWKEAILKVESKVNLNFSNIKRNDLITKIILYY